MQVKQNLPEHEGVTTWGEDFALNVGYGKTESFEIRYTGGICYNAATDKTDEFYVSLDSGAVLFVNSSIGGVTVFTQNTLEFQKLANISESYFKI